MIGTQAAARGVSPYLPLGMSPEMDRKIQRVLVLGGRTVMRRPFPAAVVLEALPRACERDQVLCAEVRTYLQRYMNRAGVTHARVTGALVDGDSHSAQPNAHGVDVDDAWEAQVRAYYQPSDYLLISAGGIASEDETIPTGSMISFGNQYMQLDVGYRDHWLSPLNDSSSLISTEAPTMPSVTLSNYMPISRLGLSYELFAAEMSRQVGFPAVDDAPTAGKPRLAGVHGSIAPAEGLAFAVNRITQYGVSPEDTSGFSGWLDALRSSNNAPPGSVEYGNRVASIASSIIFPGKTPFAVNLEYAGEDSSYSGSYRLGATNFSLGLDFPQLWRDFDVTYEVSEWQNDWYVHSVYPQGLTNRGHVIGHWFGDQRVFGDAIGGWSQSLRAGWRSPSSGRYWQATYRMMSLDEAWRRGEPDVGYETLQSLRIDLAMDVRGFAVEAGVQVGRDIFGDKFARLAASVDLAEPGPRGSRITSDETSGSNQESTQVFVDLGASYGSVNKIFGVDIPDVRTPSEVTPHVAFGARRSVSRRSDFGVRVELDRLDDVNLISVRALDYRFRFGPKLAFNGFFGAGRYDYGLPAYGYYWGLGVQVMDVLPGWDLSLDGRHHEKLGRDKALPNDPPSTPDRTRLFFDADTVTLYLSRRL